jgi:hypothetical protein
MVDVSPEVALRAARKVMWFRLAEQMGCTVAELKRRMSSQEFIEWVAFRRWDRAQQQKQREGVPGV